MKMLILLLAVAPTLSFAAPLTCVDLQLLDYDSNGNQIFQPTGASVEVRADATGKYGWIAETVQGGTKSVERDVALTTVAAKDVDIKDLVSATRPDIKWADVARVMIGNIGVEANKQDGAGTSIFALLDANGVVLGKVAQVGWGAGKCTN